MGQLKFPVTETGDASVVAILDDVIVLPSGKAMGSSSLICHIMNSGVWCERYTRRKHGGTNHTLVKKEVADAIQHWLQNSELDGFEVNGYAGLPLEDYLRKMFVENG